MFDNENKEFSEHLVTINRVALSALSMAEYFRDEEGKDLFLFF